MRRNAASSILAILVALATPACVKESVSEAPSPRSFTFRLNGEPETMDWNLAHTTVETHLLMNLMEGLVTFDSGLRVVPALAESWEVGDGGKTYTFRLRQGVKWSDGVPLKAHDFVYGWRRLLSPVTAASYAYFLFDIVGAEDFNSGKISDFAEVGIKAPDDRTLQIKLRQPVAHWIYIPTFWVTFPLREDIVSQYGTAWHKPGRMVTVGPYTLQAYDVNSRIIFKSNPHYYGQKGNVDEVTALIVQDDSTALKLYESGRLDFLTEISTLDLQRLSGRSDLRKFPYLKTGYLGFTVDKYPISNVKLRRAIAMAIDRSKIGVILHGGQEAAASFVPPRLLSHNPKMGLPYDPERARAEFKASGAGAGRKLKIELLTPNWDKQLTIAQFIQGELDKNLGISVEIQPFDHKTYRAQLDLRTFPFFELQWGADYPDPDNFLSVFLSSSGNNRTNWKNAEYDRLVNQGRVEQDQRVRERLYLDAQRILIDDEAVIIPLYYEPNMALVRPRVQGLELNPMNYLYLRKLNVRP